MKLAHAIERLLPGEVAPMFQRTGAGVLLGGRERWRGFAVTMFRRRLLVDVITPAR